jgi:two-component system chemotaxis response regulator CheY
MVRVLIVDDEEAVRDMLRRMLEARGHEVALASDGATALATYQRQRPDVVVLDMLMPDPDGLAVLASIRRLDPSARVTMLSSLREEAMVLRALELGARDYVVKPVLFQQLHECVERLASQPLDPPASG